MLEVAGREVRLSNPAKVYFPKPGWTKLDLVEYYLTAADAVLTHLRERPTVMKRFVNGITEEPIWQKRVPKNIPDWLQTATVAFPSGRTAEELVANDEAHLVWAVNLGVIDFNPHPVRRADLDHPDELRVDLDPTPEVGWAEVRKTAMVVDEVLTRARPARLPEDERLQGHPRQRAHRARVGLHRGPPRRARAGPRGRAPRARPGDQQVVEGGAPRRVRRLQPERARPHRRLGLLGPPDADARVSCALDWDEVARRRARRLPHRHRARAAADLGDPAADIDLEPGSLDAAARPRPPRRGGRARRRALAAALPQAARRAQARAAEPRPDRPTQRGRAGDPQPGGPPPGVSTSAGSSAASARSPARARATSTNSTSLASCSVVRAIAPRTRRELARGAVSAPAAARRAARRGSRPRRWRRPPRRG